MTYLSDDEWVAGQIAKLDQIEATCREIKRRNSAVASGDPSGLHLDLAGDAGAGSLRPVAQQVLHDARQLFESLAQLAEVVLHVSQIRFGHDGAPFARPKRRGAS